MHLAGISDTEFDMPLMQGLKARGCSLSTDMQSFVRHVTPVTHDIEYSNVGNKKEIAAMMDKLKLDIVEARILTGRRTGKSRDHCQIMGLPGNHHHALPGRVRAGEGKDLLRKILQQQHSGRTGRGDTTFSAYLSWRLDHDPKESLKFAAALVSIKMETPGPFKGTLEDVLKRLKEKHSA